MVTSPAVVTLKTVWRRLAAGLVSSGSEAARLECEVVGGGGGGGTEKSARSWASVSRIREVMSWWDRSALVKILGEGKL